MFPRTRPFSEPCKLDVAAACMHLHGDDVSLRSHGHETSTALWMQLLIQVPEELNPCHIVKSDRGKEALC
jgi:hypothetical protein